MANRLQITLGPVLFEWKREALSKLYEKVAQLDVDVVYMGEVVCSKKLGYTTDDIEKTGLMLERAGKKVVVSSLAIVSNEDELDLTRRILDLPFAIEANDVSVFNMAKVGKEIWAGPHITAYNAPSVEFLKSVGIRRVCFPVELPGSSMAHIIKETGVEAEVFAHGRLPLAFSWRCYTSRAHGLTKTECKHHCALYPAGFDLKTLDNEPLFCVNGTSILSAKTHSLVDSTEDVAGIGARAVRISPGQDDIGRVVKVYRDRLDNKISAQEALSLLREICPDGLVNGWYAGKAGKDLVESMEAVATV